MSVRRVVSGGQTGADRGGLDGARDAGVPIGGWCPRGRRAEDGPIPAGYPLRETASPVYAVRTDRNVRDSDATVLFTFGPPGGGSALTVERARRRGRPLLHLDLAILDDDAAAAALKDWLAGVRPEVLNVAGSRESQAPGLAGRVRAVVARALR